MASLVPRDVPARLRVGPGVDPPIVRFVQSDDRSGLRRNAAAEIRTAREGVTSSIHGDEKKPDGSRL
jgi:hypothetical protein